MAIWLEGWGVLALQTLKKRCIFSRALFFFTPLQLLGHGPLAQLAAAVRHRSAPSLCLCQLRHVHMSCATVCAHDEMVGQRKSPGPSSLLLQSHISPVQSVANIQIHDMRAPLTKKPPWTAQHTAALAPLASWLVNDDDRTQRTARSI